MPKKGNDDTVLHAIIGRFEEATRKGDYKGAAEAYSELCDWDKQNLGIHHPDYIINLYILAGLYYGLTTRGAEGAQEVQNSLDIADSIFLEAQNRWSSVKGAQLDHALKLREVAGGYYEKELYPHSEAIILKAMKLQEKMLPENHPDYLDTQQKFIYVATKNSFIAQEMGKRLQDLDQHGRYSEAIPIAYEKYRLCLLETGEEGIPVANTLDDLAILHLKNNDLDEAMRLFLYTIRIRVKKSGKGSIDYATSLTKLGWLYTSQKNYLGAENLFFRALEIYDKTSPVSSELSTAIELMQKLAIEFQKKGLHKKAILIYDKIIEIGHRNFGEVSPLVTVLSNAGWAHLESGDSQAAKLLFMKALEITRKIHGDDHPYTAEVLNSLAWLYHMIGRLDYAKPLYLRALEIRRNTVGENSAQYAFNLNNLGMLYNSIGDYIKAEQYLKKALEIGNKVQIDQRDLVTFASTLAQNYYNKGDFLTSELLLARALDIAKLTFGEESLDVAYVLNQIASHYLISGDHVGAESRILTALDKCAVALSNNPAAYASCLQILAHANIEMGNYSKAKPIATQALEKLIEAFGKDNINYIRGLTDLAVISIATGDIDEGLNLERQIIESENQYLNTVFAIASDRQRSALSAEIQRSLQRFLSLVIQNFMNSREVVNSAFDLVLHRKSISTDASLAQRQALLKGKYPENKEDLTRLDLLGQRIGDMVLSQKIDDTAAYDTLLRDLISQKEELEESLASKMPDIRLQRQLRSVNHRVISDTLQVSTAYVEFVKSYMFDFNAIPSMGQQYWREPHYIAFILSANNPNNVQIKDLGRAHDIDDLIKEFIKSITSISDGSNSKFTLGNENFFDTDLIETGIKLRKAVFDPLVSEFKGCNRLYIAPDGELSSLPFEALPTDSKDFLIDIYAIAYIGTCRDLLRFSTKDSDLMSSSYLIVDPDYDLDTPTNGIEPSVQFEQIASSPLSGSQIYFSRLLDTEIEGQLIRDLLDLDSNSILMQDAALESSIKALKSPNLLHIATHGFFFEDPKRDPDKEEISFKISSQKRDFVNFESWKKIDDPLFRSGLALAGANSWAKGLSLPKAAEDGILTADDIVRMDLTNTHLVVLSACDTARGEIRTGEGVFGLRRSFLVAGAQALVMSLWKVSSKHTREFMVDFYLQLKRDKSRSYFYALNKAKLNLKKKYSHPYFWGAFIFQGNPGSITNPYSTANF